MSEIPIRVDRGVLELAPVGPCTIADFLVRLEEARLDPEISGPLAVLIDTRKGGVKPTSQEIEEVTIYFKSHADFFVPLRALVTSSLLMYGLGRIANAFESNHGAQMKVFRDIEGAREWLREGWAHHVGQPPT